MQTLQELMPDIDRQNIIDALGNSNKESMNLDVLTRWIIQEVSNDRRRRLLTRDRLVACEIAGTA